MARATKAANRVRIIAGEWRGRWIEFHPAEGLRPTGDRIRETLFNWLQSHIVGAHCLDLFAGSGALGFEAASRGAAAVVMLEQNPRTAAQLRAQAQRLGAQSVNIRAESALVFLAQPWSGSPFNLVFLDPPFATDLLGQSLARLAGWAGLSPDAMCYLEYSNASPPLLPPGWRFRRQSHAGEVGFGLIERETSC